MLSLINILPLAAGGTIIYFTCQVIYRIFFHPLKNYPGPVLDKINKFNYIYHLVKGDLPQYFKRLHEKYGDVVRVGVNQLDYCTSQAWTGKCETILRGTEANEIDIYGHRTANGAGNLPKYLEHRKKDVNGVPSIILANDDDHRRMRRLQSHMFSEKALNGQEPMITGYIDTMITRMQEKVHAGKDVVDIVKWYNYCTFDILGDLAFGEPFGGLESDSLHPWITLIYKSIKDGSFLEASSELPPPINKLVYALFTPRDTQSAKKTHFGFSTIKAHERISQGAGDREDFTGYILRHNEADKEKGMSIPEIESNASLLIIAGSETTATFLSGITYNLCRPPNVNHLHKLTTLLRTQFSSASQMTILELNKLEYLSAILEEGLRTYPPVPTTVTRWTQHGGTVICGKYVPQGTIVGVNPLAAYQLERNFRDPDKFAPERWMGDERYANDDRKAMQPFSTGPRNCIGKNLAYAEMRLILARVLWHFDLELQEDSMDWSNQKVFTLWQKVPLSIKLVPRKS